MKGSLEETSKVPTIVLKSTSSSICVPQPQVYNVSRYPFVLLKITCVQWNFWKINSASFFIKNSFIVTCSKTFTLQRCLFIIFIGTYNDKLKITLSIGSPGITTTYYWQMYYEVLCRQIGSRIQRLWEDFLKTCTFSIGIQKIKSIFYKKILAKLFHTLFWKKLPLQIRVVLIAVSSKFRPDIHLF